jgi:hypothetical protein
MNTKIWIIFSFILIALLLAINTVVMAWSDTYSVAHPNRQLYYSEPNRNFLKMEFIRTHPKMYDSFIFGSSKVGSINPRVLDDGHFYNMTYSAGIPREHLLNLKLMIHSGVKIKNLLIGLEDISYQESFVKRQFQGITKAHPMATGESWFEFYFFYFFRFPSDLDRKNVKAVWSNKKEAYPMDVVNQDKFYKDLEAFSQAITIDEKLHINDPKFLVPAKFKGNELKATLEDIQQIVDVCNKYEIKVKFFINPIHITTYNATDKALLKEFKTSLATITDYYDFSGPSSITRDNRYWSDTTHFDTRVGNYIIESLYGYGTPPSDFGYYVPSQRVD